MHQKTNKNSHHMTISPLLERVSSVHVQPVGAHGTNEMSSAVHFGCKQKIERFVLSVDQADLTNPDSSDSFIAGAMKCNAVCSHCIMQPHKHIATTNELTTAWNRKFQSVWKRNRVTMGSTCLHGAAATNCNCKCSTWGNTLKDSMHFMCTLVTCTSM